MGIENEVVLDQVEGNETDVGTEGQEQATPTPNKYEESARHQGWVPKEEWQGDPEDWTDAKEFMRRGELFSKISSQSSEIKELKKAMTALVEHHVKVKETEFTRALEYLKQQKKAALEEGDADKLLQVEDAIDTLKEEQQNNRQVAQQPTAKSVTPVFSQWVDQNRWYLQDAEMKQFADDVGVGFYNRNPGKSEQEVYEYVRKRVQEHFPKKFSGQKPNFQSVEGGSSSTPRSSSKGDDFKLTEEQTKVMKTFVRQGIMTEAQYKEELRRVSGG